MRLYMTRLGLTWVFKVLGVNLPFLRRGVQAVGMFACFLAACRYGYLFAAASAGVWHRQLEYSANLVPGNGPIGARPLIHPWWYCACSTAVAEGASAVWHSHHAPPGCDVDATWVPFACACDTRAVQQGTAASSVGVAWRAYIHGTWKVYADMHRRTPGSAVVPVLQA